MGTTKAGGGYEVDHVSVWALGHLVTRAGKDAHDFHGVFKNVADDSSEQGEGFLARIWPKLDEWKDNGERHIKKGAELAARGGQEIYTAGNWYRDEDKRAEALIDYQYWIGNDKRPIKYPNVDTVDDPDQAGRFEDAVDINYQGISQSRNNLAGWPDKIEEDAEQILALGGTVGTFAAWIEMLTGKDIFAEAANAVVGDWRSLQRVAFAFSDAGNGFEDIATNIDNGRFGIDRKGRWEGDAGDACKLWLARYSTACTDLGALLVGRYTAIKALANAAYHLMQSIKHELAATVDALLLLITRGRIAALQTGKTLAELIGKIAKALGRGKSIWDLSDGEDTVKELIAIAVSIVDRVGAIRLLISRLLAIAHEFALLGSVSNAIGATIGAETVDEPNWPELYDHKGT
ncbi:MAG: hypothetical protein GEU98_24740 [Pseudonocardiaceae bacterium]|nr:hypothetical protein [Pseudonocardiaceae bacterium]